MGLYGFMSNCCINNPETPAASRAGKCPECSDLGTRVATITLKHIVKPSFLDVASKPGFLFCPSPNCGTVYFHPDGERFSKGDLRVRVGLKETEDPVMLCYCFGFTEAMVIEEIDATGDCDIAQRIASRVRAGDCACEVRNPQGSCCLGTVRAAVKRLKAARLPFEARPAAVSDQTLNSGTAAKLQLLAFVAILGAGVFAA